MDVPCWWEQYQSVLGISCTTKEKLARVCQAAAAALCVYFICRPRPPRPPSGSALQNPLYQSASGLSVGGNATPRRKALKKGSFLSKHRAARGNAIPRRYALTKFVYFQNTMPPEAMLYPDAMFLCIVYPYCIHMYAYFMHIDENCLAMLFFRNQL